MAGRCGVGVGLYGTVGLVRPDRGKGEGKYGREGARYKARARVRVGCECGAGGGLRGIGRMAVRPSQAAAAAAARRMDMAEAEIGICLSGCQQLGPGWYLSLCGRKGGRVGDWTNASSRLPIGSGSSMMAG